ncbi:serine/threonine-protein kinase [Planctomyces sp. SH-PL62]|uniref:serine/threonine-protein kinase n=1 Tax=Planctomyces sp. SH-PL62 TaxID=1636152 RepID=UPI00078DEFFD|nr:serine/threonine-protein kinase [Planctomyces sp. SH-PL62]AMV38631.1 Serine/threonine-protein kinase PknB [Planctomyces sp. SH-PL62]
MSTDHMRTEPAGDSYIDLIPTEFQLPPADDGLMTARLEPHVGAATEFSGSLAAETQDLRRRRLASAALFLAFITAGLLAWSLLAGHFGRNWGASLIRVGQFVLSSGVAAVLLSREPLSRRTVKGLEFGLFGAIALSIGAAQYLLGVEYLRQSDALGMATYLKNGVIGSIVLMLLYGALIPNDAATAAKVILSMALVPVVAFTLLLEFEHPDLVEELEAMRSSEHSGSNVVALLCGASLAIYCAHVLNGLRKDLHDARKFGQYQLGRRIGVGGMGEVFLAEHQLLKRPCALKLIKGDAGGDSLALARFEREVKSAARLSHPNTIAIYDYGRTDEGTFYYVMEYLPGMSLQDLVSQHGPVSPGRLLYLLRQVCGGLAEAHALGIIHRDLKPANIFVALRGGEADVAKILDFGLVKLTADPDAPELTTDRSVSGTPAFMAPEQATGDRPVDPRTDVYALGAIAYYALTGRPPFEGTTAMAVMIAQVRDPVVPPSQVVEGVPEDLERVILRCLAKAPDDRYANVKALARDLAACASARDWDEDQAEAWWNALSEPVAAPVIA